MTLVKKAHIVSLPNESKAEQEANIAQYTIIHSPLKDSYIMKTTSFPFPNMLCILYLLTGTYNKCPYGNVRSFTKLSRIAFAVSKFASQVTIYQKHQLQRMWVMCPM